MTDRSDEIGEVDVEPHRWWDRRMGVLDNLRFGFVLPALCLLRGHRFYWYGVVGGPFGICDRCAKTAERARLSGRSGDTP